MIEKRRSCDTGHRVQEGATNGDWPHPPPGGGGGVGHGAAGTPNSLVELPLIVHLQ